MPEMSSGGDDEDEEQSAAEEGGAGKDELQRAVGEQGTCPTVVNALAQGGAPRRAKGAS